MKNHKTKRILATVALVAVFSVWNIFPLLALASEISVPSVIKLINDSRTRMGVPILTENAVLDAVAKDKIKDMLANDYFAHNSPQGKDPWFWFAKNGYQYSAAGENLAINFKTVENQHEALMRSESHKKNILNPAYTEVGVAVAQGKIDGKETTLMVQVFGAPVGVMVNQKPAVADGQVLPAEAAKNLIPISEQASLVDKGYGPLSKEDILLLFFFVFILLFRRKMAVATTPSLPVAIFVLMSSTRMLFAQGTVSTFLSPWKK